MKIIISSLLISIISQVMLYGQSLDFEQLNDNGMPAGWVYDTNYAKVDSIVKRSGNYSLYLDGRKESMVIVSCQNDAAVQGDTLTLAGYARVKNLQGNVRVILSILGSPQLNDLILSSDYIITDNRTGAWNRFELKIPLCEQATHFMVASFVNGIAEVWYDDMELTVDGMGLAKAKKRTTVVADNQPKDMGGDDSVGVFRPSQPFTPQQIENLNVLCRVWGLMKYYHPAIVTGEVDWDRELLSMIPEVYDLGKERRNELLLKWIDSFGGFATRADSRKNELEWIGDTDRFGPPLSAAMQRVANSCKSPYNYYYSQQFVTGIPVFYNERPYPQMDYTDTGYRLLGLFRLWNVIEFFYPYRNMTDDRDAMLTESIAFMSNPEIDDKAGYVEGVYRLLSRIHDSHGFVADPEMALDLKYFSRLVPFIPGEFVEGKIFVEGLYDPELCDLKTGDAITHIDGKSILDFINENSYRFPSSNHEKLCQTIAHGIAHISNKESVTYRVDRDGQIMDIEAKTFAPQELAEAVMGYVPTVKPGYMIVDDSTAYIDMGTISAAEMDSIRNTYFKYPKLIIDFRGYAGDGASYFLADLLPGTFQVAKFYHVDPMRPGNFIAYPGNGDYLSGANSLNQKIVLIVDHNSQSHMEYMSMMLQNIPGLKTIGTTTAGADGNITNVMLPGGIVAWFTGLGLAYPDGEQCQGVGIHIDEIVKPSLTDLRAGRDTLLERAKEILE